MQSLVSRMVLVYLQLQGGFFRIGLLSFIVLHVPTRMRGIEISARWCVIVSHDLIRHRGWYALDRMVNFNR